ncbi:MAG: HIRAN domain-containing protein [Proteobacteria bacterium]|nr:HIRAN domain-containing protein [Pseudomonadota bacterium]
MATLNRRSLLALFGIATVAGRASAARSARPPVVLLRTHVNGEAYYEAAEIASTLRAGTPLTLRREPDNAYDRRAIEVLDAAGRKLGYVPRSDNPAVARMMDAGERMRASVTDVRVLTCDIRMVVEWLPG